MIKQYDTLAGEAAAFAIRAHEGQIRTGTRFPYVVHPIGTGMLLRQYYPDNEALEAAGYLHDVIEDTDVTYDDLIDRFGMEVAYLVHAVTRRPDWNLRFFGPDANVMRLKAADVIDNIRDTVRGLRKGHDVWSRFSGGRNKVLYWRKVATIASQSILSEPIWTVLDDLVEEAADLAGESI